MKALTKSNKKKTLIGVLLFQIGLFSTYSQNFSLNVYTSEVILGTDSFEESKFKVFPNPSKDLISLKGNTQILTTLNIYSVSDQHVISNLKLQNSETSIDISSLKTGFHIIELKNELETRRKKFIKK